MSHEDPIQRLMELMKKREAWEEKMSALSEKASEMVENELIAELWRDLGDHTETYWEAMLLVKKFIKCLTKVRKELSSRSGMSPEVMRKLASCIWLDASMQEVIKDIDP